MSEKVISGYLKNISKNDPKRDLFMKHILPSLRNPRVDCSSNDTRPKYTCGLCKIFSSKDNEKIVTFTNFYAYLRHLGEKHQKNLPCDGNIFNTATIEHRCNICDKLFNRKEHFKAHLRSQAHISRKKEENNTGMTQSSLSSNKSALEKSDLGNRYEEIMNFIFESTDSPRKEIKKKFEDENRKLCNDAKQESDKEYLSLIAWINNNKSVFDEYDNLCSI